MTTNTARGGGSGAGRPSRGLVKKSLWADPSDWAVAAAIAAATSTDLSEVIRQAIRLGLDQLQDAPQA